MTPETHAGHRTERGILFLLRIGIGWTFLWAAIHHFGNNAYVSGFLSSTKTFNAIYAPMAHSSFTPVLAFLVEYGHLLIGLSLISGLLVRASAPFAIMIMVLYWTAHMDFPYIENVNNFLVDYHLVYALALGLLIIRRAGHIVGLDAWASRLTFVRNSPLLRWLTA
ncbi:thiosulfate dehydrogenase [quinone] large subunit [Faunimonas pinastri]|uniref:Thiosulfate dehydrogenase [quinone] large subunit n=1 Tax=Faunimonas pinastri TaxID=1855383 RepID=A0A1H9KBC9_9HYPH|nr:DoxX family protein [Faunimonas pinastri]SEQ96392.1 thiosulfate dehydrogenase [quinone] large subunit [Faunimonas pinastri]